MIINTGMRTDVPAFYAEWFANRLREGYVCTRNPYCPNRVTKYSLSPEVVDLIVFCTKNPAPMLEHRKLLEPYGQYWFVTITPYGRETEPNVPAVEKVMEDFRRLSGMVGADGMAWRYDPIMVTETYTVERHLAEFERMAEGLAGATHTCVISFIDLYGKVRRNFPQAREVSQPDRIALGKEMIRIAKEHDMIVRTCAEGDDLAKYGADCGGCMTQAVFEKALGCRLNVPKEKSPRPECGCLMGKDIGQYDTCGHLCKYCYANSNAEAVRRNRTQHDPRSPLLIGKLREEDVVREARQASWRDGQVRLFDVDGFS